MVRAKLGGFGLDSDRTSTMAVNQRPNIFGRLESGETNGAGFSGRGRPCQADVLDHALAPIVKAWTRFLALPCA